MGRANRPRLAPTAPDWAKGTSRRSTRTIGIARLRRGRRTLLFAMSKFIIPAALPIAKSLTKHHPVSTSLGRRRGWVQRGARDVRPVELMNVGDGPLTVVVPTLLPLISAPDNHP